MAVNYAEKFSQTIDEQLSKDSLTDKAVNKDYDFDPEVVSANYCKASGKLAGLGCGSTAVGYYSTSNMPESCTGHASAKRNTQERESSSGENSDSSGESSTAETQDSESSGEAEPAVSTLIDDDDD